MTILEFMQANQWLTIALACIAALTCVVVSGNVARIFSPYLDEPEDKPANSDEKGPTDA